MYSKKNKDISNKSPLQRVMTVKQTFVTLIISIITVFIIINGSEIKKLNTVKASHPAVNNDNDKKNSSNEQSQTDSSTNNIQDIISDDSSEKYKNGEYVGEAQGFKGSVKVKVLVANGTIKNIEIVENVDDPPYFNKATSLVEDIINKNTPDVDTISGATFSSKGIINAVNNALKNAQN